MSAINGCRNLVSSVWRKSLAQTGGFRSVCSIPGGRCRSLRLTRRCAPSSASSQQRPHVYTCCLETHRWYSEVYSESSTSEKDEDSGAPTPTPSDTFNLDVLVSLLRQENAVDICVIKVPDQIKYAEYFIVVSGISPRHLRAMALYAIKVYKFLKKDRDPNVKVEGKDAEDWMCVDFGNMVVHLMLPETRDAYELEKLWTLRNYDDQLRSIPAERLPEDFIYDVDITK